MRKCWEYYGWAKLQTTVPLYIDLFPNGLLRWWSYFKLQHFHFLRMVIYWILWSGDSPIFLLFSCQWKYGRERKKEKREKERKKNPPPILQILFKDIEWTPRANLIIEKGLAIIPIKRNPHILWWKHHETAPEAYDGIRPLIPPYPKMITSNHQDSWGWFLWSWNSQMTTRALPWHFPCLETWV